MTTQKERHFKEDLTREQKLSRRQAINKLLRVAALAASFGGAKITTAQIRKEITKPKPIINWNRLKSIKATDPDAKALKVLIFNDPLVYTNEYSRKPHSAPLDPSLGVKCSVNYFQSHSKCSQHGCDSNNCSGQGCSNLGNCDSNRCTDQNCSGLSWCGTHKANMLTPKIAFALRNDPFIQALSREFNVVTTEQLLNTLRHLLQKAKR